MTDKPIKTFALINRGVVTNTVVAADPSLFKHDELVIEIVGDVDQPGIGWLYDGTSFSPPPSDIT